MKKIFFLFLILLFGRHVHAQTTGYIRNDTIKLTNAAKNATLVIESASRGHNWYLKDIGNGRTQFVEATIADVSHLQDSLGKKANDTAVVHLAGSESIRGSKTFTGSTFLTPNITGSSGTNIPPFIYSPTINQTGNANYNLFRISPYIQHFSGNEGVSFLLDIGYRSAAYPTGTHTSLFSFSKAGNFSASGTISTGDNSMGVNGVMTHRFSTTGNQAQGHGSVENSGMLANLKSANMGTDAYSGMPTASVLNAQAFYLGIPTFLMGTGIGSASVVTVQDASTMTIAGPPVGENSYNIFTNKWAFRVATGNSYFGGNVRALLPPSNSLDVVNKRSADSLYSPHLATITNMQDYTGQAMTIIVTDSLRGGMFNYIPNSLNDGGLYFTATGKNSGSWQRQCPGNGVSVLWYGAKGDYNYLTNSGTDDKAAIQAAYDSKLRKGQAVIFPVRPRPYCYGISGYIKFGQSTASRGVGSNIVDQINASSPFDTISLHPLSAIKAYNGTPAFVTDTTDNFRVESPQFSNLTIIGSGRTNNVPAISFPSNPHFVTSNPNSKDVGNPKLSYLAITGFTTAIDFKKADTYWTDHIVFFDCQVGIRNGKQAGTVTNNEFGKCDTAIIGKGALNAYANNTIEPNGVGIVLDSCVNCLVSNNRFFNATKALVIKTATTIGNHVDNNLFLTPSSYAIEVNGAGSYNTFESNHIQSASAVAFYARQTSNMVINNLSIFSPGGSNSALQLDTCSNFQTSNIYVNDYAVNKKMSTTGSSRAIPDVFSSQRINGSTALNSQPGIYLRHYGANFQSPSAGTTSTPTAFGAEFYDGSNFQGGKINLFEEPGSTWSGTNNETRFRFSLTPSGSNTAFDAGLLDATGLTLNNGTNKIKFGMGTGGSVDLGLFQAQNTNKGVIIDYAPSGTSTTSRFRLRNNSNLSNYGTMVVGADLDTGRIAIFNNGTPTNSLNSLVIGRGGNLGSNITNLYFHAASLIRFNRAFQVPLTGLLKANGSTSDITTVSGTSSQFVMGDGSLADLQTAKRLVSYTVATLPASPTIGDQAAVIDATAPTYLGTLTGGGSTYTPVVYNGTVWIAH